MTLEEAIVYCDMLSLNMKDHEKASVHAQCAEWLRELRRLRSEICIYESIYLLDIGEKEESKKGD